MKIIQITDLHLPAKSDVSPAEYNYAWERWDQMRDNLERSGADFIVNTGDICRAVPAAEIYERYYEGLAAMSMPVINLSGNHDELDLIESHERLKAKQKKEGVDMLFLHCTPTAELLPKHQDLLHDALDKGPGHLLVFMHYPPLYAGSPYMDGQYAFAAIDTLLPVLEESAGPITIFCGHYHMARTLKSGSLTVHITPSPFMNIDPAYAERVACKRYTWPYREIKIEDGQLSTNLVEAFP